MATDPRPALDRLVAALEAHLGAAQRRRGEQDPAVEAAYRTLADAFEAYDEALYDATDEATPFVLYDDVEDAEDDDGDDGDDVDDVEDADEDEELDDDLDAGLDDPLADEDDTIVDNVVDEVVDDEAVDQPEQDGAGRARRL